MKIRRAIVFGVIGAGLFLNLWLSSASSRVQSIGDAQWGTQVDGLQISISPANSHYPNAPEFQVALRNVGEQDFSLNLGFMLANGKVQLPERIGLSLTDSAGRTRKLKFSDRRYAGIAGRVDRYVVPLRAGSIYTLKLSLNQFWSPDTKEFTLELFPGKYQITAQFEGGGATIVNPDMAGIALMNYWRGKVQSNVIVIER